MEELEALAALLTTIDARPTELLERLAQLVRASLNAKGATVIVEGSVATAGDVVVDPVLAAPLKCDDIVMGQLTLASCAAGAYAPQDALKLKHFASVAGRVLETASKNRALRRLAETDECSGLPNRRYLYRQLDKVLERARRERSPRSCRMAFVAGSGSSSSSSSLRPATSAAVNSGNGSPARVAWKA